MFKTYLPLCTQTHPNSMQACDIQHVGELSKTLIDAGKIH